MEMEFFEADIKFNVDGKPIQFKVIHNCPETAGLSMNDAVTNWVHRTDEYTAESLCAYVNSKGASICFTEEEFKKLSQED